MTEFEIIQSYRQAKDKNKQIGILADLAAMDKQKIIEILINAGEVAGVKAKRKNKSTAPKRKTEWTPELTSDLVRMYDEGLKTPEIAERLGIDNKAVSNKLYRMKKLSVSETNKKTNTDTETANCFIQDELEKLSDILDCLHAIDMEILCDPQSISYLISEAMSCAKEMREICILR